MGTRRKSSTTSLNTLCYGTQFQVRLIPPYVLITELKTVRCVRYKDSCTEVYPGCAVCIKMKLVIIVITHSFAVTKTFNFTARAIINIHLHKAFSLVVLHKTSNCCPMLFFCCRKSAISEMNWYFHRNSVFFFTFFELELYGIGCRMLQARSGQLKDEIIDGTQFKQLCCKAV